MRKQWPIALVLVLAGLATAASAVVSADEKAKAPTAPKKEQADFFGLTKVHTFHLELAAKEYDTMQQTRGGFGFGPGPRPGEKPPEKPADKPTDVHKGSGFGIEYPWAHADLVAEGQTYKTVGLRYKGNASYMASSRGLKRNFKVALDHYDEDGRFLGMKSLNLNAGALDPTRSRESLAFAVYRACGVPAPRTTYAEVTLTVPGKYDKEYLGIYTVIEQVDKTFLKDRFKNNKGMLLKPERIRGLDYLGDDWAKYKDRYQPKHEPTKEETQRLIEFVKLVNRGDDAQFKKEIASYLDVDEFLRFLAGTALVANLDSFFTLGHNYYLYLNPATNKFVFIPWDLDLSLGSFGMMGSSDQQADLSLTHPYGGENKLTDRLLAMPEVKEKYQKLVKELAATAFTKEQVLKDLDALEKTVKEPLAKEKKAAAARKEGGGGFGPGGPGMFGQSLDLRTFLTKRADSVLAQAEGKSKGYEPRGFGGPGGPGGLNPAQNLAAQIFKAAEVEKEKKISKEKFIDGAKKLFAAWDKDKKGSLDEKALADGINSVMMPGNVVVFPGGPGGPGGIDPALRGIELTDKQKAKVEEIKVAQQKKTQDAFEQLRDGKIALNAMRAATEKIRADVLKDMKDVLTKEQYEKFEKAFKDGPVGFPGPGGPGGPGPFPGGPGGFPGGIEPALRGIDLDEKQKAKVEEVKAAQQKKTQELFEKLRDGKLDPNEMRQASEKLRDEVLKDMKDVLTKEQYAKFEKAFKDGPGGPRGPGGPGGPGVRPAFGPGQFYARILLAKADADLDGKLTLDELVKACETFFKDADKNKDGVLDEKELTEGLSSLLAAPGGPGGPRPGDRPPPGGAPRPGEGDKKDKD